MASAPLSLSELKVRLAVFPAPAPALASPSVIRSVRRSARGAHGRTTPNGDLLEVLEVYAKLEPGRKRARAARADEVVVEPGASFPSRPPGDGTSKRDCFARSPRPGIAPPYEILRSVGQLLNAPASTVTPSSPRLQLLSLRIPPRPPSARTRRRA